MCIRDSYKGVIISEANPLNGRSAYVGETPGFPKRQPESLNLGMKLAGESIQLRFRVGTDAAAGAPGWDIDNLRFTGIDNTPFPVWQVDQALCAETGDSAASTSSASTSDDDSDSAPLPTDSGPAGSTFDDDDGDGVDSVSADALDDDGCGCRNDPQPRPPLALAALLLLAIRRRRA